MTRKGKNLLSYRNLCDKLRVFLIILLVCFLTNIIIGLYNMRGNKTVLSELRTSVQEYKSTLDNNGANIRIEFTKLNERINKLEGKVDVLNAMNDKKDQLKK